MKVSKTKRKKIKRILYKLKYEPASMTEEQAYKQIMEIVNGCLINQHLKEVI